VTAPVDSFPASPARAGLGRVFGYYALNTLWGAVLPAALTGIALRYFVPPFGLGLPGVIAELGRRVPLLFGVALFLLFSALIQYWLHRAGGRSAAPLLTPRKEGARRWLDVLALPALVVGAVCAALAVRAHVRPYRVFGESMVPTLEPGDVVVGAVRPQGGGSLLPPRRGDLVVFPGAAVGLKSPAAGLPEMLVKRAIGLPGDRIEMRGESPVINGWVVPNCEAGEYLYVLPETTGKAVHGRAYVEFLEDRAYLTVHAIGPAFPGTYVVKPGEVFVLGDDRGNSMDSRSYQGGGGGGVPLRALEARVQRFLFGTQLSGDADLGRLLQPVDALQVHLRLGGVQAPPLQEGIDRCLKNRPSDTHPPASDHTT
jgi:signal peptidase I